MNNCLICNKELTEKQLQRHNRIVKYCSRKCAGIAVGKFGLGKHKVGHVSWCKDLTKEDLRIAKREERRRFLLDNSDYRDKLSKALTNKIPTEETRERMSLSHIGNILSNETKRKMSISHLGQKQWNEGLTKEIDERLLKIGQKVSRTEIFQYKNGLRSLPKQKYMKVKSGFREDLGHYVRSSWEANICRIYKFLGKTYEYESKNCKFDLCDLGILILDTYLPEDNVWIEVKGYLTESCKKKWREFIKIFPNIIVKVIDKEVYDVLTKKYSKLILNWE